MLNIVSIKAHSAEKIKPQRLGNVKQCLTCPKSESNIHRRDYDRAKPVRIFELLKEDEDKQKVKKGSVCKKILPERVGSCAYNKPKNSFSHVRRNLNFNIVPDNIPNDKTNNVHLLDKSELTSSHRTIKQVSEPKIRRSLVEPNSIKNIYLQKHKKVIDKQSKLEVLKENVPTVKKSGIPIHHDKSKHNICSHNYSITKVQRKITSNDISTKKPLQASQFINSQQNNRCHKTCSLNEIHLKYQGTETLKEKDECIERLYNSLQSTKIIAPENGLNAKHASSETISVNVNEIMHLKRELENLVNTTEENLNKLKSTLSCVTRLLVPQESVPPQSGISNGREEHFKLTLDKEVQVNTCCKLLQSAEENSKFHSSGISEMHRIEKENLDIRCRNLSQDNLDESFLNLEDRLGIKQTEAIQKSCSMQNTPVIKKYTQKRSLREYMSLKSTMSFLQTPDGKALYQRSNVDSSVVLSRTSISNKVLTEFQSLYSDSPDST
nr:uncharacterized protein LOC117221344 isoform X1 [Megalopta genalis]